MTAIQRCQLVEARNKIAEIREILDNVMYCSNPVSNKEFCKLREMYNFVCQANDVEI